jgi:hypothetical protein
MGKGKFAIICKITKLKVSVCLGLLLVICLPFGLGSETQTISSYYPSPYGSYRRFYGGNLKVGSYLNYLEAGTADVLIGPNTAGDRNVFHVKGNVGDLLLMSPADGDIRLSADTGEIVFLSDLSTNSNNWYREYLSSFCYWASPASASCASGFMPLARGTSVGDMNYGQTTNFELCCKMAVP